MVKKMIKNVDLRIEHIFAHVSFYIIAALFAFILCCQHLSHKGEAHVGLSDVANYGRNWFLKNESKKINLPYEYDAGKNEVVVIEKKLPNSIQRGQVLLMRSLRQDVRIFIDNHLRYEYDSKNLRYDTLNAPSAYIVFELFPFDSDKIIRIETSTSSSFAGSIAPIYYGQRGDVEISVFREYGFILSINVFAFALGFIVLCICLIARFKLNLKFPVIYLSFAIISMALWGICESKTRQFFFPISSIPGLLVFPMLDLMCIPFFVYWNEVQRKRYCIFYRILCSLLVVNAAVSTVLNALNVVDYYDVMPVTYVLILIGIIVSFFTTEYDFFFRHIREYAFASFGLQFVSILGATEVIRAIMRQSFGSDYFICLSFLIVLIFSTVQTIYDLVQVYNRRQKYVEFQALKTIRSISTSLEAKDAYTSGHSSRVSEYAMKLAEALDVGKSDIVNIRYIALMHDIGKIGIPDSILNKPGKLTPDEFFVLKRHTIIGYDIVKTVDEIPGLKEGVLSHHERYDGKGYPNGLKGSEIPYIARILAIADSYDAMTSNRVYRKALSDDIVRAELLKGSGTQFDPGMVKVFVGLLDSGKIKRLESL